MRRLRDLLAGLFGRRTVQLRLGSDSTVFFTCAAMESSDEEPARERGGADSPPPAAGAVAPRCFLLSVDDAGQYLVATGDELVLGHQTSGAADVPLLADVGARHARLERRESLRDGSVWWIEPLEGEEIRINGRLEEGASSLTAGDRIELGANVELRWTLPDPASQSALVEVHGPSGCAGARSILLLSEGEGGRVRIGAAENRHVRVPRLEHEISIVRRDRRLFVEGEAAIRGGEKGADGVSIPCPPPQRFDLVLGRTEHGRPPFGFAVEPAPRSGKRR